MTNKQYEHLGRALMLAADLANGVECLYDTRKSLEGEVGKLIGNDAAKQIVTAIVKDCLPVMHLGTTLAGIANAAKEAAK